MIEHRVRVERRARSIIEWVPGDSPGGHKRVKVERPEFPDEWLVVEASCSCGRIFEYPEDWVDHLDAVAGGEIAMKFGKEKTESTETAEYPVLIDLFTLSESEGEEKPSYEFLAFEGGWLDKSWTARMLLNRVKQVMDSYTEIEYDTVCYRVDDGGEMVSSAQLSPRSDSDLGDNPLMAQLPLSSIVVNVVPEGRPVRVTSSRYAPYEFVNDFD